MAITIVIALMTFSTTPALAQASQGSPAWIATYAFVAAGGLNRVQYGASNAGSQPVVICAATLYYNGSVDWQVCTADPVLPHGTQSSSGKTAFWYNDQSVVGWIGSLVVYAKDGRTPIVPFGWVQIDQQGNKVINGAYTLTWVPTSPPSS